jgi:predicted dithiol-disulfide oxidoreductase (DUF899 family)
MPAQHGSLPEVVSEAEWLLARKHLLVREKELTRLRDALNADRRRLPMVRIDKDYRFEGPNGAVGLLDMFGGSRQLVIQHVMFDPDWDQACQSCSASLDEMPGPMFAHLAARQTAFAAIGRAPYPKIAAYRELRVWDFPWYSSYGSDFNYDFHVTIDQAAAPIMFNYRNPAELRQAGMDWILDGSSEQPGVSCFLRDGEDVFHTYSAFGRGTEQMAGAYEILDLTALGRQEAWEEPKDRNAAPRQPIPDFAE